MSLNRTPAPVLPASDDITEALTLATLATMTLQKTGHTLLFWGDQVSSCGRCAKLAEGAACNCPFLTILWVVPGSK